MRPMLLLALTLLVALPASVGAQPAAPGPLIISAHLDGARLEVRARCPNGATLDGATLALDGAMLAPVRTEFVDQPVAVSMVVETGAAMDEPGTPLSTPRQDAAVILAALLDRTPTDAQVSVIGYESAAKALITAATPVHARAALPALAIASDQTSTPAGRAAALSLAAAQRTAGQHAMVLLTTSPDDVRPDPAVELLTISFGPVPVGSEGVFYSANTIAAVPGMLAGLVGRYDTLLAARSQTLLRAQVAGVGAEPYLLTVGGCGGVTHTTIRGAGGAAGWPWVALIAAIGGSAAAVVACWWYSRAASRNKSRPAPLLTTAGPRQITDRFQPAIDAPTERHGQPSDDSAERYVIDIWSDEGHAFHELAGRQCTLGRDPACDICIESTWISGLHARIALVAGGLEITDLGSTNGTYIGAGRRRLDQDMPTPLEPGEQLWLGPATQLRVREAAEAHP